MRILVIEDEPRILAFLARGLEAEGFLVDGARDGATGVRRAPSGATTSSSSTSCSRSSTASASCGASRPSGPSCRW